MKPRVLVIDDDKSIRKVFKLSLEKAGIAVDTASSGEAGLMMIEDNKYSFIYLDIKMSGMNGIETLRKIRDIDPVIPVYIFTAFFGEYFNQLAKLKAENVEFEPINKPIGSAEIVECTRAILGKQ